MVQSIFALRFLVGGLLASHVGDARTGLGLIGQAAWLAATWFTYLINGVSDIDGDRRNQSSRPLASGRLTVSSAMTWCSVLAAFSVASGAALGWPFEAGILLVLAIGWFYSMGPAPLKQSSVTSSLTVGLAGFLAYVCGSVAYRQVVPAEVFEFAAVASMWMLAAGNSKDFGDEKGDAFSRRRSLSLVLGRNRAVVVVSALCLGTGTLGVVAAVSSPLLLPLGLILPAAIHMSVVWFKNRENRVQRSERTPYRVFMLSQYAINLSMVALVIVHGVGVGVRSGN